MLPVNIRMIFAGVMALLVGVVTGLIVLAETSVKASQPSKAADDVGPIVPLRADEPPRANAVKLEPVASAPFARKAEAFSAAPSTFAPAAELVPPLHKVEAIAGEDSQPKATPARQVPGAAIAKNRGARHVCDDDDDEDDDRC